MQRESVRSSNLRSVGYDLEDLILEIEFKKSGVYQFYDVLESEFNGLMRAYSHGSYFAKNIKDKYQCKKIR